VRDQLIKAIDDLIMELGQLRIEAQRIKRLVLERFGREFEDKTPVRPPSQNAMEAFKNSQDFLTGKKKDDT
jgi:hypothetical protein